jgi:hypothetical protein
MVKAGNVPLTRGMPFCITYPRNETPTIENVKFIWVRRSVSHKVKRENKGISKYQLSIIELLRSIGLQRMVVIL